MQIQKKIIVLILTALIALFNSCAKVPTASYTFNKNEYFIGDTILLSNTSIHSNSYKWKGDGINGEQSTKDVQVITTRRGIYNFELTAYSISGKRSNFLSKSINVRGKSGDVVFYIENNWLGSVSVSVDSKNIGIISGSIQFPPACGAANCITLTLEEGEHSVYYYGNGSSFQKTIICVSGTCTPINLM